MSACALLLECSLHSWWEWGWQEALFLLLGLWEQNTEGCSWQHRAGSAVFKHLWYFCQKISCWILTCQADSKGAVLAEWGWETRSLGLPPPSTPQSALRGLPG